VAERQREKEVIKRRLRELEARDPRVAEFVAKNVELFNGEPGKSESFDRLDALLQSQAYRLCHWRAASDEINYRRFFDVNALAAVCTEKADVFHATHDLTLRLAAEGALDGLRIDHVDGLYAPEKYLWRLQWSFLAKFVRGETPRPSDPVERSATAAQDGESVESGELSDSPPARAAVLRRLCSRLNMPQPDETDWPALFGPGEPVEPAPETGAEGDESAVAAAPRPPLFVVVEKILGPDEPLPEKWPVAGTTGYDFTNQLNGLFVAPDGFAAIERFYVRFTDDERSFGEVVFECKRQILRFAMGSELQMLAHHLNRISEQHRASRDFTLNSLRYALREVLAAFPVYRTYPGPDGFSEREQRFVTRAVATARRRNRAMDATTFDFIRDVLLLRHPPHLSAAAIAAREHFARRFQQVTSPIMAKGVEDTAFYVYFPLLSANEVGGHPATPVVALDAFHQHNVRRRARTPHALLATSTHDTKRSEDVRARLNLLTEIPARWRNTVNRWTRRTKSWLTEVDGQAAPSRHDEYLFYQTLVGMWPAGPIDEPTRATLIERLQAYMEKATHEAKQRTSWINPQAEYDQAVRQFVERCLTPDRGNRFLPDFTEFLASIADAGYYNAASQVVLKLLSPGAPDVYQGQDLWDFSLVDPDNRRPVDYRRRTELLESLERDWRERPGERAALAGSLAATPGDERLKLFLTWRLLTARRRWPTLFDRGEYVPLTASGPAAEHVVALAWHDAEAQADECGLLVAVVPRWSLRLAGRMESADVTRLTAAADQVWQDTVVEWPPGGSQPLIDVLTDEVRDVGSGPVRAADLLRRFPIAVLARTKDRA
jgi:(1->4)-alpha-D-glucan 1-alpha-D-glucosylmutase